MSEYLSLDEALKYLAAAQKIWNAERSAQAIAEGWDVFNIAPSAPPASMTDVSIERLDEAGMFESDDEALAHVQGRAANSETHSIAAQIDHAANSLRFHLWGREWVDSRIGPSRNT